MCFHVLIIEDEAHMVLGLELNIGVEGWRTSVLRSGTEAPAIIARQRPDLVVLDLLLPGMHGLDVLRAVRAQDESTPVVVLSGVADIDMKVRVLDAGADDYVTKPFDLREFLARVRRLLLRGRERPRENTLRLVPERSELVAPGVSIRLRKKEFELLQELMRTPGVIRSRKELLADVWGIPVGLQTKRLEFQVQAIRKKLRPYGQEERLATVPKRGYMWK